MTRRIVRGMGLALWTACGLLLVMFSGCKSGTQAPMKPADIRSEVGTPGKAKPEMTAQAKDAQAKGEQLEKEMVTAHTSGQLPMEGRK